jgi:hypothetical protein
MSEMGCSLATDVVFIPKGAEYEDTKSRDGEIMELRTLFIFLLA